MKSVILAATAATTLASVAFAAAPTGNEPVVPFKIADNLYYVGASDITSYLVTTPAGLIVLDGGYDTTAPQVLANIRTLGFDPKQVKILLNSHAHLDHAGGLAELKRTTGARLLASRADAPLLENGGKTDPGGLTGFPPVKVDGVVADNQVVELGGVKITAHLTPGHTRGCTSWSLPVRVDGQTKQALFICSVSVLPMYRLTTNPTYPGIADAYASTFAKFRTIPCDVFLGAHAQFWGMAAKRAAMKDGAPNPFVDPAGCRAFLAKGEQTFKERLAAEKAAARKAG